MRTKLIPEIQNLVDNNYGALIPTSTFTMATEAGKILPGNDELVKLWPLLAVKASFETTPEGADIYWKDYMNAKDEWKLFREDAIKGCLVSARIYQG